MTEKPLLDKLAERFCATPLPDSVCVDPCASVQGYLNRTGTNLLNVSEAREVLSVILCDVLEHVAKVEAEHLRFYHADGTFEVLANPKEVIQRRIEFAQRLESPTVLVLGEGRVFLSAIKAADSDRRGFLFRPSGQAHSIGAKDPDWKPGESYTPIARDVVIWFDSMESARVFQDTVNVAILQASGYTVTDSN